MCGLQHEVVRKNAEGRKGLRNRTKDFALRIVRMFSALPKTTEAQVLESSCSDPRYDQPN
jgi:hypothetical protein